MFGYWRKLKLSERFSSSKIYCGYVNSKNSFCGYVGNVIYQVMVVDTLEPPVAAVIGIGTGDASDSRSLALRATCADHGYRM